MKARRSALPVALACGLALAGACTQLQLPLPPKSEPIPTGRLPGDARPRHYVLELEVVPERERFSGRAEITVQLTRGVETLWLHARDLDVSKVTVLHGQRERLEGRFEQLTPDGVAAVRLRRPVGPGRVVVRFDFSAPFDETLRGLYRVEVGGAAFAFTQFEPLSARSAFPSFDEPGFKTPFDLTLVVPEDHVALANTPVAEEEPLPGGLRRVRFETTPALPTYLLAWAVGPLDLREAPPLPPVAGRDRPIPFRGAAVQGRGAELDYALAHTPPLLDELERFFGIPYPYRKLDVVAVPDFSAGAMENVGLVTFRENLLLLSPDDAPEGQRRAFTYVMAHELAHQWFGNLVTPTWWDDLWLNEAFATWLGYRVVARVHPEQSADLALLKSVQGAMDADSLVSSRRIRQPIDSHHDIRNAFDAITYSKGAGVLAMFERWLGEETFREGVRRYLEKHRHGSARASDLLAALSDAAGRDVETPFETFLSQPGVPFVEAETRCSADGATLALRQSRFLPLGSAGERDALWQIPVCVRFAAGGVEDERCTLLDAPQGSLALGDRCPDWVMPNAAAAGYYRFAQPRADSEKLLERGFPALTPGERLAVADSLGAALASGARPAAEIYPLLPILARDPSRPVATAPMPLLRQARERFADLETRPAVEAFSRSLYAPRLRKLGWGAREGEPGDDRLLRSQLVRFLAFDAADVRVLNEAARRGARFAGLEGRPPQPDALEPELIETALAAAVVVRGAESFEPLLEQLHASQDALERGRRLRALGETRDAALAARARDLSLDPRLRVNEAMTPLWAQAGQRWTRAPTWRWLQQNFDALADRVGAERAGSTPWLAAGFCSPDRARELEAFFAARIEGLEGGPRNLAGAAERIRLCAALREAQAESARAFFGGGERRAPIPILDDGR